MNAVVGEFSIAASLPASPSFVMQVGILLTRLLRQLIVSPTTYINLAISLFFLAVYTGAFGASPGFEKLIGANFLTFILPVSIVNASLAGSVAGQLLVTDLETGYLRRLQAMPISRVAIVLAPMMVGAILVVAQAALVVGVGMLLGATSATGLPGLLVVLALPLLWAWRSPAMPWPRACWLETPRRRRRRRSSSSHSSSWPLHSCLASSSRAGCSGRVVQPHDICP